MHICVFCSSADTINSNYKALAFDFGKWLADNNFSLVYGGAVGGLMDAVAKGAQSADGDIWGIIPKSIIEKNRLSTIPNKLLKVDSMANRKSLMKDVSDAFVVFPGGYGTLDEFFDVYAAAIVGEHNKPIFVFNPDNYWQGIITQFEKFKNEGTAKNTSDNSLVFCDDLDDLKNNLILIK